MDWKKSKYLRIIRRAAAVFIGAAVASLAVLQTLDIKIILVGMIAAGLLGLEKYIREQYPSETGQSTSSK